MAINTVFQFLMETWAETFDTKYVVLHLLQIFADTFHTILNDLV